MHYQPCFWCGPLQLHSHPTRVPGICPKEATEAEVLASEMLKQARCPEFLRQQQKQIADIEEEHWEEAAATAAESALAPVAPSSCCG